VPGIHDRKLCKLTSRSYSALVSVSAAHQGPDGGGPVAAIVDLGPGR
jgi:hypothetical protein